MTAGTALGDGRPPLAGQMKKFTVHPSPRPAPEAAFKTRDGEPKKLAEFKGRVLLVNYWATWCSPCVAEMPSLDRLQAIKGSGTFEVVALSIDRQGLEVVQMFRREAYNSARFAKTTEAYRQAVNGTIFYDSAISALIEWVSLAAIAVAQEMGLGDEVIRRALASFSGVKRRFTKTGEAHGITVIDDYGHHPVEIAATLRAARQSYGGSGRVIAIMQPHRFSRLGALKNEFATCFTDADTVFIADVYAAGEAPIEGVNRDMLVALTQRAGHRDVHPLPSPGDLPNLIWQVARPGDVVVCLGAGNITAWAHALPGQLQQLAGDNGGPRAIANDHGPGTAA